LIAAPQALRLPTIDKLVDVDPALIATIERFRKGEGIARRYPRKEGFANGNCRFGGS
jgi:hypothetical protein